MRAFSKKIPKVCVTACFPAGTPVAVENGYRNIEELRVGDLVWAWHEATGDLALKPVVQTMRRDSDALVALRLGSDTVQATPEHPFWVSGQGWKVAGELVVGDELLRSDGQAMRVGQGRAPDRAKHPVYNVEVADWHTYLVSWVDVHRPQCHYCLTQIKKLLASEGKSCEIQRIDLRKVKKGDNVTPHHLPSDAYMKKHGIARQRWSFNKHGAA